LEVLFLTRIFFFVCTKFFWRIKKESKEKKGKEREREKGEKKKKKTFLLHFCNGKCFFVKKKNE